jgi:acyl transferase domain-containing protein/acyl carrier protein
MRRLSRYTGSPAPPKRLRGPGNPKGSKAISSSDPLSTRVKPLSPIKQAFIAVENMQARLLEAEHSRKEPIAIIGIGCRFPGAKDPASLWRLLHQGSDSVREVPETRWKIDEYYDPNPDAPGKMSTRWGGFLDSVDQFDPEFFGVSPREAASMDPQQRLLLEVAWEALENAGQGPAHLATCRTGVFVGLTSDEYAHLAYRSGDASRFDAHFASGVARSVAGGRISYILGIEGPNMSIDTACSSSLVALHTACLYLRMQECRMALAGGVNVVLSPEIGVAFSKARMMAPDGRCKAFDARADGFVRAEGCGVVVLKRLSDAVADGDHILALIRGSAVNQDGRSSGITAPNGAAQEAVIRAALAHGGVRPDEIGYVEAHGTGTALGDPIEAHALAAVLGPGRDASNPLIVGSVKTNLGHTESAAGVAGLIKVVLALQHQQIPPHLHFQQMNPHIDWGNVPVEIPVAGRAWPRGEKRRLAGLSSFGFSGTNAHAIIEEAPLPSESKRMWERPKHILALSAKNELALRELSHLYAEELAKGTVDLGDLCYTANAGRAHFEQRLAVVGGSHEEMRRRLLETVPGKRVVEREGFRPVFLFPGSEAQYSAARQELYASQPVFRAAIDEGADSQKALARLWQSWGIEPNARSHEMVLSMSLEQGRGQWEQMLENLARLYVHGAEVNWAGFDQPYARQRVSLPTYPFQRQRYWVQSSDAARLDGWFYRVVWRQRDFADQAERRDKHHWIVLADTQGVAKAIAARIECAGDTFSLVRGPLAAGRNLDRVVDLRNLDAAEGASEPQCTMLAGLVQDVSLVGGRGVMFWSVTKGALSTGRETNPVLPWQAPVWALGRTILSEHPEFWGGMVDLDPAASPEANASLLWRHLDSFDGEDQAAFRDGSRLVARLERHTVAPVTNKPKFRADAAYLVTGGYGALGLELARWMVQRGAHNVILMGRSPMPPGAISTVRDLEKLGARIEPAIADVGNAQALQSFLRSHAEQHRGLPIRGVFHAAGVARHVLVSETTPEDFEHSFRAKVQGTWLLEQAFEHTPLDFFVLFSSASAVLSSPRLGPYAASNAFLDATAEYRRIKGQPALSVNWGAWTGIGMASHSGAGQALAETDGMKLEQGLACLDRLWGSAGQVCVLPMDWRRWASLYPAYMATPFFSDVIEKREASAQRSSQSALLRDLEHAPEPSRVDIVRERVHSLAVKALGFDPARRLEPQQPLGELGLDSLIALELRNALSAEVGQSLPATLLFNYPTVENLTTYLAGLLWGTPNAPSTAPETKQNALDRIEELSDEEVDRLLAEKLRARS